MTWEIKEFFLKEWSRFFDKSWLTVYAHSDTHVLYLYENKKEPTPEGMGLICLITKYTLEVYRLVTRSERFTEVLNNDYVVVEVRTEDMVNNAVTC